MQNKSTKSAAIVLVIGLIFFTYQKITQKSETKNATVETSITTTLQNEAKSPSTEINSKTTSIEELTKESVVIAYVKAHWKLPNYYITKNEARKLGWNPSKGNLCDVLPGRAIGGDVFLNREYKLPQESGCIWHEADLNYNCDMRGSDRLLFSTSHLIYTTHNHYKTFEKQ